MYTDLRLVALDVGLEEARVALDQVVDPHRARHVAVRLRVEVRLEHAAAARHAGHPELLAVLACGDGDAEGVVARLVVHHVAVQRHAPAKPRVELDSKLEHLLIGGDRLEHDDLAAQRQ